MTNWPRGHSLPATCACSSAYRTTYRTQGHSRVGVIPFEAFGFAILGLLQLIQGDGVHRGLFCACRAAGHPYIAGVPVLADHAVRAGLDPTRSRAGGTSTIGAHSIMWR